MSISQDAKNMVANMVRINSPEDVDYIINAATNHKIALQNVAKQGNTPGTNAPLSQPTPANPAVSSANPTAAGNSASVDTSGKYGTMKKVKANIKEC